MKKLIILFSAVSFILSAYVMHDVANAGTHKPSGTVCQGSTCDNGGGSDGGSINKNTNRNSNSNTAAQAQGQAQGQVAMQGQALINTPVIIDFQHMAPTVGKTDAELIDGIDASDVKVHGWYQHIKSLTEAKASSMGASTTDFKVLPSLAVTYKPTGSIKKIDIITNDRVTVMGSATFVSTGPAITVDGLFARVAEFGMRNGATHMIVRKSVGKYHSGSKAGIDLGGSASQVAKSDGSLLLGAGSTLGYSKAWSSNEYRPSFYVLYIRNEKDVTPAVRGNIGDYEGGR